MEFIPSPDDRAGFSSEPQVQASSCPGRKRRSYEVSCLDQSSATGDDGCPPVMPQEEDAADVFPSPEKTGNWRLNAVLEAFENLTPTREGRVKTLVRAFESLVSFTEGNGEQQARKPRGYSLQFSYLNPKENLKGREKSQREHFADGGGGDQEDVRDEEEEGEGQQWQDVGTWQGVKDEDDYGIGEQWHKDQAEREYADAAVEDEDYGIGEQWHKDQAEQEYNDAVVEDEERGERVYEKQPQEQAAGIASTGSFEGHEEEDRRQHDEQLAGQTALEDEDRKQPQKQPAGNVSSGSFEEGSFKHESEEDDKSIKAASFERQPPDQKMCVDLQRQLLQKSINGYFASTAARKKSSSRNHKHSQGSNRSDSSIRPPLVQKSQTQLAQDKPRVSRPQPFKLLTEERGHMKEQEFFTRLRRILEEEEKLRVPLAQGLPWTTDEPEVPYRPPAKENTKPLDIHLNSDLRAIERAEFDRFIAEKLIYIEERRLEEERLRRIAEEEEIKKLRQEMVPKAQLMPYFDRPFRPIRSSKRPTIPKEPQFKHNKLPKRQKCVASST